MLTVPANSKFEIRNSKFLLRVSLLAMLAALASGCRSSAPPASNRPEPEIPGEPQTYSAVVSRSFDDGARREGTVSLFARLGEKVREQWTQDGETLVSLWRPDLGKVYLLSLERRIYVESELNGDWKPEVQSAITGGAGTPRLDPDEFDRAFDYEDASERVETEELPEETVDGRSCRVVRQRSVFANGLIETIKTYRAPDLEGMAIRVESETEDGTARIKVLTERRDVRTDVTADQFEIPAGFKPVNSLSR